jgi:hypothetical protein
MNLNKFNQRRGASLILVTALFVVMMIFSYMAINIANIQRNQVASQVSTDLASRWGVDMLSRTTDTNAVEDEVRDLIHRNWTVTDESGNWLADNQANIDINIEFGTAVVAGNDIFALNILFTIIITRTIIDTLVKITFKNGENFMLSMATMVLLGIPTAILFDYGTLALMWAMFGYVCRHKQEMNLSQFKVLGFLGLTLALYFGYQQLFFTFAPAYMWAMVVFVSISAYLLYNFKPKALPDLTAKLPAAVNAFIKFSGRKTLYIYVVHILIFLTIAFFTQPDRFGFFQIELY